MLEIFSFFPVSVFLIQFSHFYFPCNLAPLTLSLPAAGRVTNSTKLKSDLAKRCKLTKMRIVDPGLKMCCVSSFQNVLITAFPVNSWPSSGQMPNSAKQVTTRDDELDFVGTKISTTTMSALYVTFTLRRVNSVLQEFSSFIFCDLNAQLRPSGQKCMHKKCRRKRQQMCNAAPLCSSMRVCQNSRGSFGRFIST